MSDPRGAPPPARHDLPGRLVILVGLALLLSLSILIFLPFVAPIVIALVAATTAYPIFGRVLRLVGGQRRGLASFLTCTVLVLLVFIPLVWLGWSLLLQAEPALKQVSTGSQTVEEWLDKNEWLNKQPLFQEYWGRIKDVLDWIQERTASSENAAEALAGTEGEAGTGTGTGTGTGAETRTEGQGSFTASVIGWLSGLAAGILANTFELAVKFAVMLYILFFFFKDGPQIAASLKRTIPLDEGYQDRVMRAFRQVNRSIIRGSFGSALLQGLIAGIAFAIVGIPAIFWGVITTIAALIPPIGTSLTMVPATLILLLGGHWGSAIFLGIAAIVIGLLDNIVRPLLMQGGQMVHPIWLLLSILGALSFFGPMGLIYGPMVLVFLGTFMRLLVEEERSGRELPSG